MATDMETRIAKVETRHDSLDVYLPALLARLDHMDARMDAFESRIQARMDVFESRMDGFENRIETRIETAIRGSRGERIAMMLTVAASAAAIVVTLAIGFGTLIGSG
jgi:hypothetical protein